MDLDFTLIYRGGLPAATSRNSRVREKQNIRRELHAQLAELWRHSPSLKQFRPGEEIRKGEVVDGRLQATPRNSNHAYLELDGFRLIPLVQRKIHLACAVRITFLRRGIPGDVVHGGDLDNRLKTLLDALRMPQSTRELAGDLPEPDSEGWFYCLLEDDCLITSLSVETHQLLYPLGAGTSQNDVDLMIHIQLKPIDPTFAALAYL
jgi:hypothetical protein